MQIIYTAGIYWKGRNSKFLQFTCKLNYTCIGSHFNITVLKFINGIIVGKVIIHDGNITLRLWFINHYS